MLYNFPNKQQGEDGIDICFNISNEIDAILPEGWGGGSSYEGYGDPTECWRNYNIKHGNYDLYFFQVSSKGSFRGYIPDPKVLVDVINILQKYIKHE